MELNRRHLLAGGVTLAAGAAGLGGAEPAPAAPKKAVQKISSQEGIIPGATLKEKLDNLEKWGFDGIEFWGGGLKERIPAIKAEMKGRPIAMAATCAGFQGALMSDQASEREKAMRTTKEILSVAAEMGSTGMIIVPAFNNQTKLNHIEGRKILMDLLPEVGEHGVKVGSRVLLEPLNRGEAWFLRHVADAGAICKEINSPGVCLMGDMYHMYLEEPSDMGAFISGAKWLHHVHLASIKRNLPGQDERDFRDGFKGLKMIGYQDFMSLECSVIGDRTIEIPKAVKFLRKQWAEA
jgi:sugar phosphate isomerase/epimerase